MKKALKFVRDIVLWTIAVVLILLVTLPLWIGPVVKGVANWKTPQIIGTGFHLGEFGLNPYTGKLSVGQLNVANPSNYSEKTAVNLGELKVDVGMASLAGDIIHVEDITLDGLFVYASGLTGGNFQDLAKHASGDDRPKTDAQRQAEAEAKRIEAEKAAEEAKRIEAEKAANGGEEKPGKKVVIDHLLLKNVKVKIGVLPAIPIPEIEMSDIGKPKDPNEQAGVSLVEFWKMIFGKVMESVNAVGGLAVDGAKAIGGAAAGGAKAVGDGMKAVGEGAANTLKGVGGSIKSMFKNEK